LSARRPITNALHAPEASVAGANHPRKNRDLADRKPRGPYALGLVGLAFAVAVCGLGHRLATYLHHGSPANRATVTRFWLEPRNHSVEAIHRIKGKNRFISDSQSLPPSPKQAQRTQTDVAGVPPVEECRPASFSFLIPFRSPPPQSFLLA
jgi:hypothetical protein